MLSVSQDCLLPGQRLSPPAVQSCLGQIAVGDKLNISTPQATPQLNFRRTPERPRPASDCNAGVPRGRGRERSRVGYAEREPRAVGPLTHTRSAHASRDPRAATRTSSGYAVTARSGLPRQARRAPNGLTPVVQSRIFVADLRCSSVKYVEYSPSSRFCPLATARLHSVRQTVRYSRESG